jgi:hypothetical protein
MNRLSSDMIAPNLYLFHYYLWGYHFLFKPFLSTPTFSGMQLGRKKGMGDYYYYYY